MKITDIRIGEISVPLKTPFKTALRTVHSVEDIIVAIHTDTGNIGYGEAPPTGVITGDTKGSIISAIRDHIEKAIVGMDIENFEEIHLKLLSFFCSFFQKTDLQMKLLMEQYLSVFLSAVGY